MAHWSVSQDSTLLWGLSCTGEIGSPGLAACLPTKWDEYTLAVLVFHAAYKPRRESCHGNVRVMEAKPENPENTSMFS